MGVRSPESTGEVWRPVPFGPSLVSSAGLALAVLVLMLLNGRPLGEGAARGHFGLDPMAGALLGKAVSALGSALAAAALFLAVGRRHPQDEARRTALLFALGTGVWAASQGFGRQPPALFLIVVAVLYTLRGEQEPAWAGRAVLPLALAVAVQPAAVPLAVVMGLGLALRWPRQIPSGLLWAAPGVGVLTYKFLYTSHGLDLALSTRWRHLELLASPAWGLVVFAPLVLVAVAGLLRAGRRRDRALAATLGAAALAHWIFVGFLREPPPTGPWGAGPLLVGLPLLFVFLPEGFAALGLAATLLAAASVGIQVLGAFGDVERWSSPPAPEAPDPWEVDGSPLALAARERVVILALPGLSGGRAFVREYRLVPFSPEGSRIEFKGDALGVTGAEPTLGDAHLRGGAFLREGRLQLRRPGDGIFGRVREGARARRLELRIVGRGRGSLSVGESTFWGQAPRWREHLMGGEFRLRQPYLYAESGGGDLMIVLRAPGFAELDSVSLVTAGDPEDAIRRP